MSEQEVSQVDAFNTSKAELYKNPNYVSLYRYENPIVPYNEVREGVVSKKELIGEWYTDSLSDLYSYTLTRIDGKKGGRFVVVRVKKEDLEKFDASMLPETENMDIEKGNYIVPEHVSAISRVEVPAVFKDNWEGKRNIPMADWRDVKTYINENLSNEAIIFSLESHSQ